MITSPLRKSRRLVYDFGFKMTIVVCWIAVAKEKKVDHNYTLLFVIYQPASNKNRLSIAVLFTPLQLRL